jgi:hypothetical protein
MQIFRAKHKCSKILISNQMISNVSNQLININIIMTTNTVDINYFDNE